MPVFIVIFFAVYGGMNALFFWKVSHAFVHGAAGRIVLGAFVLAMVVSPIVIRALDRSGHFAAAKWVAAVGYPWIAIVFWFLCLAVAADLWNLAVQGLALAAPSVGGLVLPARAAVAGIIGIIIVATAWGLVEARDIRPRGLAIQAPQLPAGARPITLAVIADMHLGVSSDGMRLERVIRLVERAHPDVIISLGDLFDSADGNINSCAERLATLKAPLGKYAIFGNHEYYSGPEESLAFHQLAGFRLLRAESVEIAPHLRLAGLDDPAWYPTRRAELDDEREILPPDRRDFTIFLKHRPEVTDALADRFDLQLSGHAHGGQFFPWTLITASQFRFCHGFHRLPQGSAIYASRGAGTWGPPIRLLAPPEVTVITLCPPTEARTATSSAPAAQPYITVRE